MIGVLTLTVLLPIIAIPISYAISKYAKWKTGYIIGFLLLINLALLQCLEMPQKEVLAKATIIGDLSFYIDGLSFFVVFVILLLTSVISFYSAEYMEKERWPGHYYALYLLYTAGMLGTVLSTNLIQFFMFFELMLLPSWALIAVWGTGRRDIASFKYFMYTEFGAIFIMAGTALIYAASGRFDILEVARNIQQVNLAIMGAIVFSIGLMVKMAVFPLHFWLPDAHAEAPTPISALLSPAMIGIGGYAMLRVIYQAVPQILAISEINYALFLLGSITLIYGGLNALAQRDFKRLLAFSSISQMGYMLLGISAFNVIGVIGAILLYVSHGLCKAILFMAAGILSHETGTRDITKLRGLASKMPLTTVLVLIGFLGLAGVPPILGFWSELYIFLGVINTAISSGNLIYILLVIIVIILSLLTAGYGLWVVRRVFYGEATEALEKVEDPIEMILPLLILAIVAVVLGIYPTFVLQTISL